MGRTWEYQTIMEIVYIKRPEKEKVPLQALLLAFSFGFYLQGL
jgi:EamA domain-containing membrane protein RarD